MRTTIPEFTLRAPTKTEYSVACELAGARAQRLQFEALGCESTDRLHEIFTEIQVIQDGMVDMRERMLIGQLRDEQAARRRWWQAWRHRP